MVNKYIVYNGFTDDILDLVNNGLYASDDEQKAQTYVYDLMETARKKYTSGKLPNPCIYSVNKTAYDSAKEFLTNHQ